MKVRIPGPLLSYTRTHQVDAQGGTMREVLADLERQFPGFRFRVLDEQDRLRAHVRFFVNNEQVFDLEHVFGAGDELNIVQALSGG